MGWLPVVVPAAAELVVGGWQLGGPSLWRDEGYTAEVVVRPAGSIIAMMGHHDAVHGLYYLIMHFVAAVIGTSAVALRLPSLLATIAAAGLTGALGHRLWADTGRPGGPVVGALAGLAYVALPLTTWYAQDARPYALATLCAVGASWLLVRAAAQRSLPWWAGYAVVLALLGWFNMFALLLVPAHGITLVLQRRDGIWRRWLAAVVVAGVLCSPVAVLGLRQSSQLYWVTRPTLSTVHTLVTNFAGTLLLVPFAAVIVLVCLFRELGRRGQPGRTAQEPPVPSTVVPSTVVPSTVVPSTAALALPWLVLPPAVLLGVSLADPVYVERYIIFCMPAMALLVSAGLGWLYCLLAPPGARRQRTLAAVAVPALIAVLAVALLAGPQRTIRRTSARPDNLREVSAIVQAGERPGDAVVYLPWDTRVVGLTYPAPFERLDNIGQQVSPRASNSLVGTAVPTTVLLSRLPSAPRVWVVRWDDGLPAPPGSGSEVAAVLHVLRPVHTWRVGSVLLGLYVPRGG